MTKYRHVGNGCVIHLPSGTLNVETSQVVELDETDAARIARNPEWVAVKETTTKSAKTTEKEDER